MAAVFLFIYISFSLLFIFLFSSEGNMSFYIFINIIFISIFAYLFIEKSKIIRKKISIFEFLISILVMISLSIMCIYDFYSGKYLSTSVFVPSVIFYILYLRRIIF